MAWLCSLGHHLIQDERETDSGPEEISDERVEEDADLGTEADEDAEISETRIETETNDFPSSVHNINVSLDTEDVEADDVIKDMNNSFRDEREGKRDKRKELEQDVTSESKSKKVRKLKVCAECGIEVTDLPRHRKNMHIDFQWFTCDEPCTHRTRRLLDLKKHQTKGGCRKNQVQCPSCGEWFSSVSAKDSHRSRFRCPSQYACLICPSTFRTEKETRKHMEDDHDEIS